MPIQSLSLLGLPMTFAYALTFGSSFYVAFLDKTCQVSFYLLLCFFHQSTHLNLSSLTVTGRQATVSRFCRRMSRHAYVIKWQSLFAYCKEWDSTSMLQSRHFVVIVHAAGRHTTGTWCIDTRISRWRSKTTSPAFTRPSLRSKLRPSVQRFNFPITT